ncbi:uncharacterized protein LOC111267757 isoform X2 [Varroa jacobsoni]|nr:uncharacterized protein LOC111247912 isoform X2 [Varroa destructor]XP_022655193.1 uncharacterized protein LOC111247912 isoform X2 [Varroa destructor]XP_022701973.1 uncharacterized protein LOC111267757 isoform X2 [Varroa jacobsoni]XP_022701974.1 uncharacterized protein LOC111267757 isoform X2 [Varroa jacobsoni]
MTHIMTSIPVTKVPKAKTKKTLKRLMLANLEEPILRTIDERADKLIENKLVSYLKEFKNRGEIRRRVMLGLNSITRGVESCSDNLKVVLLNANVRPERLVIHLQQLCVHKGIPVAAVRAMDSIARVLQNTVKALKTNITAVGLLGGCSPELVKEIIGALPPVEVQHVEILSPSPPPPASPPPCPKVDFRKLLVETKDADMKDLASDTGSEEPAGNRSTVGRFGTDLVDLTEGCIPFVDYNSFIGSNRSLEMGIREPLNQYAPSTSGYKPPVFKMR